MEFDDHMGGEASGNLSVDEVPPSLSHITPLNPAAVSRLPCLLYFYFFIF